MNGSSAFEQTVDACLARLANAPALFLDGRGFTDEGWQVGPLLALDPRPLLSYPSAELADPIRALESLDHRIRRRRSDGGTAETGVAVLLAYEALDRLTEAPSPLPRIVALEVDASLRWLDGKRGRMTWRGEKPNPFEPLATSGDPARVEGPVQTSLPRESYLAAVDAVRTHIAEGDLYQANLCQRFAGRYRGSPSAYYRALVDASAAPWSAFFATERFSLASISPELFLRIDGERIETWPIKGTRPRGATEAADRRAGRELLESEKDRAELLMIVDLERNDLGRICRTGSVVVEELAALRSYSTVHHLVGRVAGRLREGAKLVDLFRATFPGGSISGAPKIRARQILRELEPVERGFFTGALCWFGDDGSADSSILIRSIVFHDGRFALGAGGGIVADSDPESEWRESNHKARALATRLGFSPEEAG